MSDEQQFDEWYPEAKVYFDGSHYIAIPHTTNPARRRKHKQEVIIVSKQDGKLKLEKTPPVLIPDDEDEIETQEPEQVTVEEVVKATEESEKKPVQESEKAVKVKRRTTRKEIFEELYTKYLYYSRKAKAKQQAKYFKIIKLCIIGFLLVVPTLIAILMITKVINIDHLTISENTRWLIPSLLALPAWIVSISLGKFFNRDEQYFYRKLLKKFNMDMDEEKTDK